MLFHCVSCWILLFSWHTANEVKGCGSRKPSLIKQKQIKYFESQLVAQMARNVRGWTHLQLWLAAILWIKYRKKKHEWVWLCQCLLFIGLYVSTGRKRQTDRSRYRQTPVHDNWSHLAVFWTSLREWQEQENGEWRVHALRKNRSLTLASQGR